MKDNMRSEEFHPDGTYVKASLDDAAKDRIYELMDALNLNNRVPRDDLHTTIMYSRKPCPDAIEMNGTAVPFRAKISDFKIWEDRGSGSNCLVAVVECDPLRNIHEHMHLKYDATYDFPEFIPHITLSYDCGDLQPELPAEDYIVKYTTLSVKPLKPLWTGD